MDAKKGDWVKIHNIILAAKDRTANIPEDTKATNLEMWIKGFLLKDSNIGNPVEIQTITGRTVSGTLVEVFPHYDHSFGNHIPELIKIGQDVKNILWEGDKHELR